LARLKRHVPAGHVLVVEIVVVILLLPGLLR
jgi:hypothetical protein